MTLHRIAWITTILWFFLSFPIAYWDWQGRWHTSVLTSHYAFKLWLYWAQFAALPLLIALSLGQWRPLGWMRHLTKGLVCIGLVAMSINSLDIDAVFVAGDWTYEPKLDLQAGFAPLKQLRVPIFAVLGNHDVEKPGPKLAAQLREALTANGVQFVEGKSIAWKGWHIIGLDDLWGGRPREQIKTLFTDSAGETTSNRLVLTHQPDTFALLPTSAMQLGLAGHSHGGQVLLPYATDWQLRTAMKQGWYNGLYETPHGKVFVTPGIGMIGLPWRFLVPPTIDVITIGTKI